MNNTHIIVHGSSCFPYTKECIDAFARYENVIWSSWEDTPPDVIEYLKEKNVTYTINPYPKEEGMSKVNWQRTGFLNGLKIAKERGAKWIYKTRTDLDIPYLDYIVFTLKGIGSKLNVLCWDEISNGACDFCMFGEANEMEIFWSFPDINIPSERGITPQYFAAKNVPYDYTYKSFRQLIDTHIDLYLENNIPINWLKNTKEDETPLTDHFSCSALYH